jgi:hypothetical protein
VQELSLFILSLSIPLFIVIFIFIFILTFIFILQVINVFVNLFGRAEKFSVKDGKSNLRGCSLTDRSRHSSFHVISLGFSLERRREGRTEGRSVVPARNLQLLVATTFLIFWVIPKAFLLAPCTLLYPEQMFKIPAPLQVMNKCSLFQNNATFLI